jgi:hypothetical protein
MFAESVEKVYELNKRMGNVFGCAPENIVQKVDTQCSLVEEEFLDEFFDAHMLHNTTEVLDAIGDSITVIDGILFDFGIQLSPKEIEHLNTMWTTPDSPMRANNLHIPQTDKVEQNLADIRELSKVVAESGYSDVVRNLAISLWLRLHVQIVGVSEFLGIDPYKCYDEVHRSNMSKICVGVEALNETMDKYYEEHGLTGTKFGEEYDPATTDLKYDHVGDDMYVVRVGRECVMMGNKTVKPGKFLKSVDFEQPDFSDYSKFDLSK